MNMKTGPVEHQVELERPSQKRYAPAVVTTYTVPEVSSGAVDPVELNALMNASWERKAIIIGMAILGLMAGLEITFFDATHL
jgi:hypothetical protein